MESLDPEQWLVPNIVDRIAKTTPGRLYAEFPVSSLTYEQGYRGVSFQELANAINCVASFLQSTLGRGSFDFIPYIGPNDFRYSALVIGAAKASFAIFATSPRNSLPAQIQLLRRLKCRIILSPDPSPPQVVAMAEATGLTVVEIPSVEQMLSVQYPPFPSKPFRKEILDEPFCAIHTSGSTGFPKPLIYTHRSMLRCMTMYYAHPLNGIETLNSFLLNKRVWLAFPPFHSAYLLTHLCNAIPMGFVPIAPISGAISSAASLVEGLMKCPADIAVLVPSQVVEIAESPDVLDFCAKNLKMIWYCGGDLPQTVGDKIVSTGLRLASQYGSSETGVTPQLWSPRHFAPEDWKYIHYHPTLGYEMRALGDGSHEFIIVHNADKKCSQAPFTLYTEAEEYATRDLYVPHPSKKDLWKWMARRDDLIVLLNGEKTNPVSMEQQIVARNVNVKTAIVAGAQRFQLSLIIEPAISRKLSLTQRAAFIEELWPTIEVANLDCPAHGRISKSHILFTNPAKPVLRTAKGTVQRFATYRLYSEELDVLYADADSINEISIDAPADGPIFGNRVSVGSHVSKVVLSTTKWKKVDDRENFFSLGMDSLQAVSLTRKLKQDFQLPTISLSIIYTNPSIRALIQIIFRLLNENRCLQELEMQRSLEYEKNLVAKYTARIDAIHEAAPVPNLSRRNHCVLLTGSTGIVGSHILEVLVNEPRVHKIFCLNRSADGETAQRQKSEELGLPSATDTKGKATFYRVDLSQANFGLSAKQYQSIQSETTVIIHNAWPVNFNFSLSSFEPQFEGLVNLISFANSVPHRIHTVYTSSAGSVFNYREEPKVPERVITARNAATPTGYGESKYAAEYFLAYAAKRLQQPYSIARVGQVTGSISHNGIWKKAEWFPRMILSSLHVGAIPNSFGSGLSRITWIPVDCLAEIMAEIALTADPITAWSLEPGEAAFFHLINPHSVTWDKVYPVIAEEIALATGRPIHYVPMAEWVDMVREDAKRSMGENVKLEEGELEAYLERNPAIKLLSFFEGLVQSRDGERREQVMFEQELSLRRNSKLRGLGPIRDEWWMKWTREWLASVGSE